jgi:RNA polymerase sigma-70 factor (ECF subfamily)
LSNRESDFERIVLAHLDAAYNLARWLLANDQDAEDVVQDSCVRAFDSLKSFRGQDGKSWFLAIVRNTSFNCIRGRKSGLPPELMEEMQADANVVSPEILLIKAWEAAAVRAAIEQLPVGYREVVVLREFEDMSYKQIAIVTGLAMGTVMSRLSRARDQLQAILQQTEAGPE